MQVGDAVVIHAPSIFHYGVIRKIDSPYVEVETRGYTVRMREEHVTRQDSLERARRFYLSGARRIVR